MPKKYLPWILVGLITAGVVVYALATMPREESGVADGDVQVIPPGTACTMEAKLCPDGSAVGRVGPNCEFAPCPSPTPSY